MFRADQILCAPLNPNGRISSDFPRFNVINNFFFCAHLLCFGTDPGWPFLTPPPRAPTALTSVQYRIAEALTNFYDEGAALALCGLKFKDAAEKVDNTIRVALVRLCALALMHGCCRLTACPTRPAVVLPRTMSCVSLSLSPSAASSAYVAEPARARHHRSHGRLTVPTPRTHHPSQLFPDVNESIKRREGLMLDYDELRTKVKKLVQTPSQDPTKLPMVSTEKKSQKHEGEVGGWGVGGGGLWG